MREKVEVDSSIIYEDSGQTNTGFIWVKKVTVGQYAAGEKIGVWLRGAGKLKESELIMPKNMAHAIAHAILAVEQPLAPEISFNIEED